jgi:hypothetical protein
MCMHEDLDSLIFACEQTCSLWYYGRLSRLVRVEGEDISQWMLTDIYTTILGDIGTQVGASALSLSLSLSFQPFLSVSW